MWTEYFFPTFLFCPVPSDLLLVDTHAVHFRAFCLIINECKVCLYKVHWWVVIPVNTKKKQTKKDCPRGYFALYCLYCPGVWHNISPFNISIQTWKKPKAPTMTQTWVTPSASKAECPFHENSSLEKLGIANTAIKQIQMLLCGQDAS